MITMQGGIVTPIFRFAAVVVMLSLVPAGCTSFKKLTGKSNNTVLPGEREDILPPEQQVNAPDDVPGGQTAVTTAPAPQTTAPGVTPKTAAKTVPQKSCDPANPDCIPPVDAGDTVDQEAGGIF